MTDIGIKELTTKNIREFKIFVKTFIKSSLKIRKGIIDENNPNICMLVLLRDTYMCNMLLRYIGLMIIVSNNEEWIKIDYIMNNYIQNYYTDKSFTKKLILLYKLFSKNKNNDYCKFLQKMIFNGRLSRKAITIKKNINMIEKKIFNLLNVNPSIKISKKYFKNISDEYHINGDDVIIDLTQQNYDKLIDSIEDINIRHKIEQKYYSRTEQCMNDFSELIILRNKLAIETNYKTYFKYINKNNYDNTESIKKLITSLNQNLDVISNNEINKIYQYFVRINKIDSKISFCDIQKYNNIHKNNTKFNPFNVLELVFDIVKEYFNIDITKTEKAGWNNNVIVYNVSHNSNVLGRIFLDFAFSEDKKVIDPITIILSDKMEINKNTTTLSEVALVGNYHNKNSIIYKDVVKIFKEFGYIINNMCYESKVGFINMNNEFTNYVPLIMEFIAWDRDTIEKIVNNISNNDPIIIDHIELNRKIDFCLNLKLKCIDAKFDHLIHNSEQLINMIKLYKKRKYDVSGILKQTYQNIIQESIEPFSNILKNNIDHINPLSLVQEINNSQGFLYSNLMNIIFSYSTYWILKNNKSNNFYDLILKNSTDSYRHLIKIFIKNNDIDCFSLFEENLLNNPKQCDINTDDVNYFNEEDEITETENDRIITIERL
jgi:hypothetical protein